MLSLQLHAICNGQKRNFFCSVSQKLARWRKPDTIQQRLNNSDAIYCFSCLIGRLTLDVIEIKKFPDWFSDKATEDTDSRSGNLLSSAIMNLQIYEFHISKITMNLYLRKHRSCLLKMYGSERRILFAY